MITAAEINAKMPVFSLLFRRSGFVSLDNAVFVFDQDGLTAEAEFYANDGPTILIFNEEVCSIKARLNNAGLSLLLALRRSSGPAELQQWLCAMLSAVPTSACRAPVLALRNGSAQIVDFYAIN